jgi:phosphoribosyl 1,2-cyclic phosphate phosphodiesterase
MTAELRILGSGTSQGVPVIGCKCETCRSSDPRDRRSRPSALFRVEGRNLLIDTSSDFRDQMLRFEIDRIDAVLLTHHHFDHIGGFDDLRQFNQLQQAPIPIFGSEETLAALRRTFRYAFVPSGHDGGAVPQAELMAIEPGKPFRACGISVTPVPVFHGRTSVLGYRIGTVAYLTDVNRIPESSWTLLAGIDTLVIDGLRHTPHPTHFHIEAALAAARVSGARRTYLTHMTHNVLHARDEGALPDGTRFAYDGLVLQCNGVTS